ncbi:MAG: ParB/RepB/Spo0J family partition protein [Firmicutes bacterium]|nr:ParB/RepB/Spo0J family partition protein [Bacillota bacterium]
MSQKGLGKGLGALIAMFDEENENLKKETKTIETKEIDFFSELPSPKKKEPITKTTLAKKEDNTTPPTSGVLEIDINLIDNNVNQPRKTFDPTGLQELADSIASSGVFQPILLNKVGGRYMIVAGERRWRASKLAGLNKIPALIRDYSPRQVAEIAIVENLQREDLNEIELAKGIKKLMDDFFLTQEKVATVLGKNRSSIANTLRLLNLPSEVQHLVETNQLSAGHAKCLVAVSNVEKCIRLAHQCVTQQLSVRELENIIKGPQIASTSSSQSKPQSIELRHLARELTLKLGTKVVIQGNESQGKILIEYYDKKDLIRLSTTLKD